MIFIMVFCFIALSKAHSPQDSERSSNDEFGDSIASLLDDGPKCLCDCPCNLQENHEFLSNDRRQ